MKRLLLMSLFAISLQAEAVPTDFVFSWQFDAVSGTYAGDILPGMAVSGTFTYDTDEANASSSDTTPSTTPGHEYTSRYGFSGGSYGVSVNIPALGGGFSSSASEVVVNDNLFIDGSTINNYLPSGTYDWIEIFGSNTIDVCLLPGGVCQPNEFSPADGEEWTVGIFSDTSWITDGSKIPDSLPASYTAFLVGLEFDPSGVEAGAAFASAVPLPAAGWMFLAGLAGLFTKIRHTRKG